jgi:hypothetical protein
MIDNVLVYLIPYLNRHFNIAVSETIHVHMCMFKQQLNITIFMVIQLINMNTGLREYLVEGWVMASPDFPISLIVSNLNRCSRTQSMQAYDRSADPPVDEVVVHS